MLRVTVEERGDRIVFRVEGRLLGPWVSELERCWRSTAGHTHAKFFSVDLDGVDFVDDHGKALLTEMDRAGVDLIATGCMMRSIIQQVAAVTASTNFNNAEEVHCERTIVSKKTRSR
jgi:hypothetical protein